MTARSTLRNGSAGAFVRRVFRAAALGVVMVLSTFYGLCTLCLLLYRTVDPPTTGVHIQRRVESWFEKAPYRKRYHAVPAQAISAHLKHAVVTAEDARFYEHGGIDWDAIRKAYEDNLERDRTWRGGSTITQQLVKNLFMTTYSSYVRKAMELPLTYLAEWLLPKERILALYLNVVEWDRGVYGAEAASQQYYRTTAARLTRSQAAALAACLPAPRQRTPQHMGRYTRTILRRMRQMGW